MELHRFTGPDGAKAPGSHHPDPAASFRVDVHPEPDGTRVSPHGEVDLDTVGTVRRRLDECVAAGCDRVLLDLRAVTFLDSTGVYLVLDTAAAARAAGWELVLIEGPANVQRTFELAGVRDRLRFLNGDNLLTARPRRASAPH